MTNALTLRQQVDQMRENGDMGLRVMSFCSGKFRLVAFPIEDTGPLRFYGEEFTTQSEAEAHRDVLEAIFKGEHNV